MTGTAVRTAGGSRVIALTRGKTGTYISVDGAKVTQLVISNEFSAEALAAALDAYEDVTVLIIGTKADGSPGWDDLDDAELVAATEHTVVFLTEGQALHRAHKGGKAAYLILATAIRGDSTVGSARLWVQSDDDIHVADVTYLGESFGPLYLLTGKSLAVDPGIVAGIVESILAAHPDVRFVYLWSQDGFAGLKAYEEDGIFWDLLRRPQPFEDEGGKVEVIPTAFTIMVLASTPRPEADAGADDKTDASDDEQDSDA